MLRTNLPAPTDEHTREIWQRALQIGRFQKMRGHWVLLMGSADYIKFDGELYSINSDPGSGDIPFGIRWHVNQYSNSTLDKLAEEQFEHFEEVLQDRG